MASYAASSALGLGAGAALYNFGYQGAYKEDLAVASGAACAVFAALAVTQKLLAGGEASTPTASSTSESKKKKKKAAQKAESSDDSESDEPPKNKANSPAKAKAAPKGKAKEEKKDVKQEPDKKADKQKAKKDTEQSTSTKATGKDAKKGGEVPKDTKKAEATKDAKKGDAAKDKKGDASKDSKKDSKDNKKVEAAKDVKKGGASEKKQEPPKSKAKAKKEESDASDDEEAFLRLGQKNTAGLVTSRTPAAEVAQSEDESEEEDAPAKAELSNSKSATRRRRQKENKEKAAAAAVETGPSKPKKIVDKDGFETVPVTKRPAKKPAAATSAVAASESKADAKPAAVSAYSDTIELESKHMALLIGPKGATLNALSEACGGVKIDTPVRDSGDKRVTLSGPEDSVRYCKAQIVSLTTKGFCSALNPGITSSNMTLDSMGLASLIGPGGSNIKKIQEVFNVRIVTPARGTGSQQVTISGQKDNVKKTKECIKQLIEHGFSSVTHEGYEVGEVPFPRDQLRHLIGPGGQTIKSIQGDTRTKVKIPAEDAENQNVQVVGPAAGVARAIKQISTLLERKAAKEAARAEAAGYGSEDDAY